MENLASIIDSFKDSSEPLQGYNHLGFKALDFQLQLLKNQFKQVNYEELSQNEKLRKTRLKINCEQNKDLDLIANLQNEISMLGWQNFLGYLPSGYKLRPSQLELAQKLPEIFKNLTIGQEIIFQKDTGTGKTLLFAIFCQLISSDKQIPIVVPTIDLGEQTIKSIAEFYPHEKITYVFSSDYEKRNPKFKKSLKGRIVVFVEDSFINTINANPNLAFQAVIQDESHLYTGQKYEEAFAKIRAKVVTFSFTATPFMTRIQPNPGDIPLVAGYAIHWADPKKLPKGRIVHTDNQLELVKNQELCPIKWMSVNSKLSFEAQRIDNKKDDYIKSSIDKLTNENWGMICDDFIEFIKQEKLLEDRKNFLVVCPSDTKLVVSGAQKFHAAFNVPVAVYTSKECFVLIDGERIYKTEAEVLEMKKAGLIRFTWQIRKLREGHDDPTIDAILMMSFTKSVADYKQFLGRGRRRHESKDNLLVVDLVPETKSIMNPLVASEALGTPFLDEGVTKPTKKIKPENKEEIYKKPRELNTDNNYLESFYSQFLDIDTIVAITREYTKDKNLSRESILKLIEITIQNLIAQGFPKNTLIYTSTQNINKIDFVVNEESLSEYGLQFNPRIVYIDIPKLINKNKSEGKITFQKNIDRKYFQENNADQKAEEAIKTFRFLIRLYFDKIQTEITFDQYCMKLKNKLVIECNKYDNLKLDITRIKKALELLNFNYYPKLKSAPRVAKPRYKPTPKIEAKKIVKTQPTPTSVLKGQESVKWRHYFKDEENRLPALTNFWEKNRAVLMRILGLDLYNKYKLYLELIFINEVGHEFVTSKTIYHARQLTADGTKRLPSLRSLETGFKSLKQRLNSAAANGGLEKYLEDTETFCLFRFKMLRPSELDIKLDQIFPEQHQSLLATEVKNIFDELKIPQWYPPKSKTLLRNLIFKKALDSFSSSYQNPKNLDDCVDFEIRNDINIKQFVAVELEKNLNEQFEIATDFPEISEQLANFVKAEYDNIIELRKPIFLILQPELYDILKQIYLRDNLQYKSFQDFITTAESKISKNIKPENQTNNNFGIVELIKNELLKLLKDEDSLGLKPFNLKTVLSYRPQEVITSFLTEKAIPDTDNSRLKEIMITQLQKDSSKGALYTPDTLNNLLDAKLSTSLEQSEMESVLDKVLKIDSKLKVVLAKTDRYTIWKELQSNMPKGEFWTGLSSDQQVNLVKLTIRKHIVTSDLFKIDLERFGLFAEVIDQINEAVKTQIYSEIYDSIDSQGLVKAIKSIPNWYCDSTETIAQEVKKQIESEKNTFRSKEFLRIVDLQNQLQKFGYEFEASDLETIVNCVAQTQVNLIKKNSGLFGPLYQQTISQKLALFAMKYIPKSNPSFISMQGFKEVYGSQAEKLIKHQPTENFDGKQYLKLKLTEEIG
jgi:superfamily II DNA or RNA helicase